ncbi:AlkA N-terminal domain-containing protein [Agarilytica rhodophyticola]|uniref:AlkA N-terminal domain-containing protein n=1 Tax=Agarilytica rhodophyticola TaxID=1737490 RepID=UPI000B342827|nr:AlkA N-terminal domain-containing protein [Agarilytica rhodophyticola]
MYSPKTCSKARLSRDPRFDGKFFTAVKTTGIYCRSICPAVAPKEENVVYYAKAIDAANAGYRPCLRCRPDSAPDSPVWKGVNTTLERAIKLIDQGALHEASMNSLAERLGISDRYLRQLFNKHLGISPKAYSLYQQCLFAKQLLHQTQLPITQVALASGFNSIRRFNDCFSSQLNLTPSQVRKTEKINANTLQLHLSYRPPYDWPSMRDFLTRRAAPSLEWTSDDSYGRSFTWMGSKGCFTARHMAADNNFKVTIDVDELSNLKSIVNNIRRILDLDVDIQAIEEDFAHHFPANVNWKKGLRLPGVWSVFEAGIRAILGQQVSLSAAHKLLSQIVNSLGEEYKSHKIFPRAESLATSDFDFLKIPESRKRTLRDFSQGYLTNKHFDQPDNWAQIKGIGPWTINYAQLRGLSNPDIFLNTDLVIKKTMANLGEDIINSDLASPWRSYLTLQLWHLASINTN